MKTIVLSENLDEKEKRRQERRGYAFEVKNEKEVEQTLNDKCRGYASNKDSANEFYKIIRFDALKNTKPEDMRVVAFQKAKEYLQPKIVARICTNNLKPQDTVVKLTAEEHLEYCLQHKDDLPMNFIKTWMVDTPDTKVIICEKDNAIRRNEKKLFAVLITKDYVSVLLRSNKNTYLLDVGTEENARKDVKKHFKKLIEAEKNVSFRPFDGKDDSVMHQVLYQYYVQTETADMHENSEFSLRDFLLEKYRAMEKKDKLVSCFKATTISCKKKSE